MLKSGVADRMIYLKNVISRELPKKRKKSVNNYLLSCRQIIKYVCWDNILYRLYISGIFQFIPVCVWNYFAQLNVYYVRNFLKYNWTISHEFPGNISGSNKEMPVFMKISFKYGSYDDYLPKLGMCRYGSKFELIRLIFTLDVCIPIITFCVKFHKDPISNI